MTAGKEAVHLVWWVLWSVHINAGRCQEINGRWPGLADATWLAIAGGSTTLQGCCVAAWRVGTYFQCVFKSEGSLLSMSCAVDATLASATPPQIRSGAGRPQACRQLRRALHGCGLGYAVLYEPVRNHIISVLGLCSMHRTQQLPYISTYYVVR